jgi:hypothetical protein
MIWLAIIILCYLIGSFPSGYLVGKSQGIDIRQHGSRNIGATNVLRVMGKKWGYLVFFCDSRRPEFTRRCPRPISVRRTRELLGPAGFLPYRSRASRLEAPRKYRSSGSRNRESLWSQAIAANMLADSPIKCSRWRPRPSAAITDFLQLD